MSAPGEWKPDREISNDEQEARDQLRDHINAGLQVIVATKNNWKQGDTIKGTWGIVIRGGRLQTMYVTQPFLIRRSATFEEWIANTPPWIPGPKPAKHQAAGFSFYEISTD